MITIWLKNPDVACWNFNADNLDYLKKKLPGARITVCNNKEEFLRHLPETVTAVIWTFKQEWFSIAPRLKLVITPAAGRDYFNIQPPSGIRLEYSSFHGPLIAETVTGMMLSHSRGLAASFSLQRGHLWPRHELSLTMKPFRGSLVTILGFGNIGECIGEHAKKLKARICGVNRNPANPPRYFDSDDRIISMDNFDAVLPETDHLVIALPRTEETTNIINQRRLNLLKSSAAVYNIGRGNAIDEDALVYSLNSGQTGAAYLDVFKEEPLPSESVLRKCRNLFIMPHASSISPEYLFRFIDELVEKLNQGV